LLLSRSLSGLHFEGLTAGGEEDLQTTEIKSQSELAQHGVLPSLAGGEWPGRYDLYCDFVMVDMGGLYPQLLCYKILAMPAAAAGKFLNVFNQHVLNGITLG
jgi:hypothetical protein